MNIKEFKDVYTEEIRTENSLWVRHIARPISFYFSYFFKKMGLEANQVTYLSMVVIGGAFVLFLLNSRISVIVAALLVNLWMILDCADGNLARVSKKKNPYGEFVDAMAGYTTLGLVLLGIGAAAGREHTWLQQFIPQSYFIFIGALTAISTLLYRLLFQKFIAVEYKYRISQELQLSKPTGLLPTLDKNFSISGLFQPALLLAAVLNFLQFLIVFYFFYYTCVLICTYAKLIMKVESAN